MLKWLNLLKAWSQLKVTVVVSLDITNGGLQSSTDTNSSIFNITSTTRMMPVTSRTTSYEILGDESSDHGFTQATIISEPYFDAQTPRNVTGLVGKKKIDIWVNFPIYQSRFLDDAIQTTREQFTDNRKSAFFLSPFHLGKSAYLSCRVRNLANKTVSWIRHRDIHILTVGSYTYTSDQRFQATHHKDNDEWTLQIKWAQKRDGGGNFINSSTHRNWLDFFSISLSFSTVYECQISTQPVRSYFVNLNVVGELTKLFNKGVS